MFVGGMTDSMYLWVIAFYAMAVTLISNINSDIITKVKSAKLHF